MVSILSLVSVILACPSLLTSRRIRGCVTSGGNVYRCKAALRVEVSSTRMLVDYQRFLGQLCSQCSIRAEVDLPGLPRSIPARRSHQVLLRKRPRLREPFYAGVVGVSLTIFKDCSRSLPPSEGSVASLKVGTGVDGPKLEVGQGNGLGRNITTTEKSPSRESLRLPARDTEGESGLL